MDSLKNLTRRNFVKAPAAALAAPAFLPGQSPNDQIRVGIIGIGGRGSRLLTHIMKSPGIKVVAVCDIDPDAAARAKKIAERDAPELIAEFRDLLDRKDIDAVFVATPVNLHKEMAVAALEVHKHLYLEKPMGRTAEDVAAVYRASKTSRGLLQLGFQLRYDPRRAAAVEHIRSGGIGNVAYMQADRHTGDLPRQKTWYFDASVSGNMIVEQAVHILDIMNWAMDGHPVKAYGSGGINVYRDEPSGRSTYDHYIVIYEYPNDIRLSFSHIFVDPRGFSGVKERVWGSEYAIDLPSATKYKLEAQARTPASPEKLRVEGEGGNMNQRAIDSFFDHLRKSSEPLNNAEWGRMATLGAIMGRTSIEEQRIVRWEEVAG
jgi:predicted dehydrogenase